MKRWRSLITTSGLILVLALAYAQSQPGGTAALVVVVGLAASSSLQALLSALIAGRYLQGEKPFEVGESISISGVTGTVEHIGLRATYLRLPDGGRGVIPNSTVFSSTLTVAPKE